MAEALVAQEEFLTWGQFQWHYRAQLASQLAREGLEGLALILHVCRVLLRVYGQRGAGRAALREHSQRLRGLWLRASWLGAGASCFQALLRSA